MGESHGIPQFNGKGYDDWQFRVKIHLDSLGLLDVLTGDPLENADHKLEFLKDSNVTDKIVSFLHADCISFVPDKDTTKEMRNSLNGVFGKNSVMDQLLIRKSLAKMRMTDGGSLVSHLAEFS